jgi:hypothetical protein
MKSFENISKELNLPLREVMKIYYSALNKVRADIINNYPDLQSYMQTISDTSVESEMIRAALQRHLDQLDL